MRGHTPYDHSCFETDRVFRLNFKTLTIWCNDEKHVYYDISPLWSMWNFGVQLWSHGIRATTGSARYRTLHSHTSGCRVSILYRFISLLVGVGQFGRCSERTRLSVLRPVAQSYTVVTWPVNAVFFFSRTFPTVRVEIRKRVRRYDIGRPRRVRWFIVVRVEFKTISRNRHAVNAVVSRPAHGFIAFSAGHVAGTRRFIIRRNTISLTSTVRPAEGFSR